MEASVIQELIFSLRGVLDTIRISDIIDIAVMSMVIYKLLWMVRKTSSGRVLKGVLVLLLAVWLCSVMKLYATLYLLNIALEWGMLALVISFGALFAGNILKLTKSDIANYGHYRRPKCHPAIVLREAISNHRRDGHQREQQDDAHNLDR